MGLTDFFSGLISRKPDQQTRNARILNGEPVFSQFGQNVYASDLVQMAIDVIASECSKLQPRHIRTDDKGAQTVVKGSINRLFRISPNPLMTTRDFMEKVIWLLFLNYNAFIYPLYDNVRNAAGQIRREYTGLYPLNPYQVDFQQDGAGKLFTKMYFTNGDSFTLPYADVIHLRKKYSEHDILGGGANGQPDSEALLKVLEADSIVVQGVGKAVKAGLAVRILAKVNTMLDDDAQRAERARFERMLASGEAGVLPIDIKGDVTALQIDPKVIDTDTMKFIQDRILYYYGVSWPILTGDFKDEQYQAFYEKTLEPLLISLGQAFSKTIFTARELDVGNEIVFYGKSMMYLSTKSKTELLKIVGEQGLLTDDQKLGLLGYPPLEDGTGNRRTMSLNYIDVSLANEYQMTRAKTPALTATAPAQDPVQNGGQEDE